MERAPFQFTLRNALLATLWAGVFFACWRIDSSFGAGGAVLGMFGGMALGAAIGTMLGRAENGMWIGLFLGTVAPVLFHGVASSFGR